MGTTLREDAQKVVFVFPRPALGGRAHNSWLHRFRRILVRWEKRAGAYLAILHLACALIAWRAVCTGP